METDKNIEYWQDHHIEEIDVGFICYNECGQFLTITHSIDDAREQIELYSKHVLSKHKD